MTKELAEGVWRRAGGTCEYCSMPQVFYDAPHQIDHIIALKHGGETVLGNLALSCFHCNTHKGQNIAGLDQESGEVVRLFHPRQDRWSLHFHWNGAFIEALSAVGRVTINVLEINAADYVAVRQALIEEGVLLLTGREHGKTRP